MRWTSGLGLVMGGLLIALSVVTDGLSEAAAQFGDQVNPAVFGDR